MRIKNILNFGNKMLQSCLGTAFIFEVILGILGYLLHDSIVYGIGIIAFLVTLFVFIVSICIYYKSEWNNHLIRK